MTATPISAPTRRTLQRVAAHVLARRRYEMSGHFGLRPAPGGLATPAFGDAPEVLRLSGDCLVREVGGTVTVTRVSGASLRQLATAAATDLGSDFSCGSDTPELGDIDAPLELDGREVAAIGAWWGLGSQVLDAVLAGPGAPRDATTSQLWPEHFDTATTCTLANGEKVNLGFSAGDSFSEEPYAYVGPWQSDRPGDAAYWNAPFGAVLGREAADAAAGDPFEACVAFVAAGLRHLA